MPDTSLKPLYADNPRPEMQRYIPADTACVLDVGCSRGAFGAALKGKGVATVWGVEADPDTAAIAATRLDKVMTGFFGTQDVQVPDQFFDVIVFNDVLEHMPDPWAALRAASGNLKPGGFVLASLPNIRQIDNLLHILLDKDFRYEKDGIRDSTHLRFYTQKSIPRLFEQSGYAIRTLEGINDTWWTPELWRRLAFRLFRNYFEDTRYLQYAVIAAPVAAS